MPTQQFEGRGLAGGDEAILTTIASNSRTPRRGVRAPQYRGDGTKLNPEELLVASLASCQLLTYLALAPRGGVAVLGYEDTPVGTLAIVEKKMRVAEILLRPRITIAADGDVDAARTLVERAHENCFIGNSISCAVRIEPEIVRSGA
jgi:organic hydroperoxide reductase OsmC/OhrA